MKTAVGGITYKLSHFLRETTNAYKKAFFYHHTCLRATMPPTEKGANMTQYEKILQYINDFGSISPMEAFSDLGITKLATRISEMRKDGIEFEQVWECSKNRYGDDVRYMRYSRSKS